MEVATDSIYFIIYVTYIIVTTTCFALSSVLYLTKGIKTPLSNNKVHQGQEPHCHRHPHGRLRTPPDVHNHRPRL